MQRLGSEAEGQRLRFEREAEEGSSRTLRFPIARSQSPVTGSIRNANKSAGGRTSRNSRLVHGWGSRRSWSGHSANMKRNRTREYSQYGKIHKCDIPAISPDIDQHLPMLFCDSGDLVRVRMRTVDGGMFWRRRWKVGKRREQGAISADKREGTPPEEERTGTREKRGEGMKMVPSCSNKLCNVMYCRLNVMAYQLESHESLLWRCGWAQISDVAQISPRWFVYTSNHPNWLQRATMISLNYKQYTGVNIQFIYFQHMIVIMYIRDNNHTDIYSIRVFPWKYANRVSSYQKLAFWQSLLTRYYL